MAGLGVRLAGAVVSLLLRARVVRWLLVAGVGVLLLVELDSVLPPWVAPVLNVGLVVAVVVGFRRWRARRRPAALSEDGWPVGPG